MIWYKFILLLYNKCNVFVNNYYYYRNTNSKIDGNNQL